MMLKNISKLGKGPYTVRTKAIKGELSQMKMSCTAPHFNVGPIYLSRTHTYILHIECVFVIKVKNTIMEGSLWIPSFY